MAEIVLSKTDHVTVTVSRALLEGLVKDVVKPEKLDRLALETGQDKAALEGLRYIELIKLDAAGADFMGWRQHRDRLKEEGYDV